MQNKQRVMWDIYDNETNEYLETVHTTYEEALHCYDASGGNIKVKPHRSNLF